MSYVYGNPMNAARTPRASSTTLRGRSKTCRRSCDRKQRIEHASSFVVSSDEQHGHSGRRHAFQRRECRVGQPGRHAASLQQVTPVDDHIDLAGAKQSHRAPSQSSGSRLSANVLDRCTTIRATALVGSKWRVLDRVADETRA
jgi:hypothetical protein